jgi:lipopolysaccharide/colanic/teichoic acid biosynthesis glycosyltransferase
MFDIVTASAILLLLSPVFLLIILLISVESRGKVFYTSPKVGKHYQTFFLIRFYATECIKTGKNQPDTQTLVESNNDLFTSPLKAFLYKTRLNELPQLINVLRGDMAIVGSQALSFHEAVQLTSDQAVQRFSVPAGITGLWQVSKNLSPQDRIALENKYAKNCSLWKDIKIILNVTLVALRIKQPNIY